MVLLLLLTNGMGRFHGVGCLEVAATACRTETDGQASEPTGHFSIASQFYPELVALHFDCEYPDSWTQDIGRWPKFPLHEHENDRPRLPTASLHFWVSLVPAPTCFLFLASRKSGSINMFPSIDGCTHHLLHVKVQKALPRGQEVVCHWRVQPRNLP
jgi:hypothetical protein